MNFCVVQGLVVGEPRIAELPSGETALSFDVQTHGENRASVPVEWTGSASSMPTVQTDYAVAVVGTVARRFYRAGGSIQTRVYISPETIVVRQPKRQERIIRSKLEQVLAERPE